MWWKWMIFGLIIFLAPIAVINLYYLASKKQPLSDDQKKNASVKIVQLILYYWLADFFYMVSFNHWLVWQFILGISILLVFFTSLAASASSPTKKTSFITFSNLLDLVIGVGVSVYLIYLIPNCGIKNILAPIVAAIYGGLLTLVGVAWTIKKGDKDRKEDREQLEKDRKEEERKKAIPFVAFIKNHALSNCLKIKSNALNEYEERNDKANYCIGISGFAIKNISNYPLIMRGAILNAVFLDFETPFVLEKNGDIGLEITENRMIKSNEPINDLCILLDDIFGNSYKVRCKVNCKPEDYSLQIDENQMFLYRYAVMQVAIPVLITDNECHNI